MRSRARNAWLTLLMTGFVWAWSAHMMPTFPTPISGPPGTGSPTNNPAISVAYNLVKDYLNTLIELSSHTKHYDIFIAADGLTYQARRGDVDDVVDQDTDIGALCNRLSAPGGVTIQLKTSGTYRAVTPITLADNCTLLGYGPGTVIQAQASAAWTMGSANLAGSFMLDLFNSGAGHKWVIIKDIYWDANNLAEGGIRMCGLLSDTTQWNLFTENFVANFKVVGIDVEDQSTSGGTRQHVIFNKIGPGTSGVPTRGIDIACNDIHFLWNDIFRVSDVGVWVRPRGVLGDKSVSTWWWENGHVHITTYVAGGVSPDTQPVNFLVTSTSSSGNIRGVYLDNIHRYAIYLKPATGNKQSTIRIQGNWFNGANLVDVSGSDKGVGVVLDAANVSAASIYNIMIADNQGTSSYTNTKNTAGRWLGIVALRNGVRDTGNYCQLRGNTFRGCLSLWDPAGVRPDSVSADNFIQPANNNTSQGTFSGSRGLWTTLGNLLANPSLLTDTNADGLPDGWIRTASSLTSTYPGGGVWQGFYPNAGQMLYQDVPIVAGVAYSASAIEQITVDAGTDAARISLQFLDENGVQCVTGGNFSATSSTGLQGPTQLNVNNKTAPVDDGHYTGTVDTSSGTAAIVAKTGSFANDLTDTFVIQGAGAGGADLVTTVASYTDSTHVTLNVAPSASLTDAVWFHYGHGDAVTARMELKANGASNVTIQWQDTRLVRGTTTGGQSGANTTWLIPHGLGAIPNYAMITPANSVAGGAGGYVSALDATNITVTTASVTGPQYYWEARL